MKKYIEEQVFPALVYIYPPAEREMLSENDILCENFVNSHKWRNLNNLNMIGASDCEWKLYLSYLWTANHKEIKNCMNRLRNSMYIGVRDGFFGENNFDTF